MTNARVPVHRHISSSVTAALLAVSVGTPVPVRAAQPAAETGGDPGERSASLTSKQQSEFDRLLGEASTKFDAGDFQGAVDAFEAAYAIRADASLLYNIGRVYEEMGSLEPAIEYYSKFARQPGIKLELREQAIERVKVLKDIVAATAEDEPPPPEPAPLTEEPVEPVSEPEPEPGPDGRGLRIAGYTMLGIGGGMLIGGGVAGGLASADANDLEAESDPGSRSDLKDSGESKALAADILFISGGVVAVTGLALAVAGIVKKRRMTDRNVALTPAVSPTYGGVSFHLRY